MNLTSVCFLSPLINLKRFFPSEEILTYAYLRTVELANDNSYVENTV